MDNISSPEDTEQVTVPKGNQVITIDEDKSSPNAETDEEGYAGGEEGAQSSEEAKDDRGIMGAADKGPEDISEGITKANEDEPEEGDRHMDMEAGGNMTTRRAWGDMDEGSEDKGMKIGVMGRKIYRAKGVIDETEGIT